MSFLLFRVTTQVLLHLFLILDAFCDEIRLFGRPLLEASSKNRAVSRVL